jgi:hypothetical protein
MLTITDSHQKFELKSTETVSLELKLNVTSKGKVWAHIGHVLFDYRLKQNVPETLIVSTDQYQFLLVLLSKGSYNDCYDL